MARKETTRLTPKALFALIDYNKQIMIFNT